MPISASITANSIDLESISTMSALFDLSENVPAYNQKLEDEIVYNLATEYTVDDMHDITTQNIYTSPHSGTQFFTNRLTPDSRELFDIVLPPSTNDGNFALSTQYLRDPDFTLDSVSVNIGNNIQKTAAIVDPTLSLYDSFLNITATENYGPFYDSDESFSCTFDDSANNNIIRALNSHINTTDHSYPLTIREDISFNTNCALAINPNKYFTVDSTTGELITNDMPDENRADLNGFTINTYVEATNDSTEYGTYQIIQANDVPEITVYKNEELSDITNVPLFDLNIGLDGSNNLPEYIPTEVLTPNYMYNSIFDTDIDPWATIPGYVFSIDVVDVSNAGYSLRDVSFAETLQYTNISDNDFSVFTMDNNYLTDNYKYMNDYVQGNHSIVFNDASVNIIPGLHANSANISSDGFSLNNIIETLPGYLCNNGQILLNINSTTTRTTETQNSGVNETDLLSSVVIYNDEGSAQSKVGISEELKTNKYVEYTNTLLVKKSSVDVNYSQSNGASFNLVNNNTVVSDLFNPDEIVFNSFKSVSNNTLEIFRINTTQLLQTDSANLIYDNATNTAMPDFYAFGYINNFSIIINEQGKTVDKLKLQLQMKPLTNLTLFTDASNALWGLTNKHDNMDLPIVSSNNSSAYPEDITIYQTSLPSTWPNLYPGTMYNNNESNLDNEIDIMLRTTTEQIDYTITLTPTPSFAGSNIAYRYDAYISWGKNAIDAESPTKPWQIVTSANILNQTNTTLSTVIVDSNSYALTPDFLIEGARNVILIKKTVSTTPQCDFKVGLLPYDNLTLTTPEVVVVYTYYLIQYTLTADANGTKYTNTTQLKNIVSVETNPSIVYSEIHYVIPEEYIPKMSFSGVLTSTDFKEFDATVVAYNDDETTTDLTDIHPASAFYALPLIMNLKMMYETVESNADITINIGGSLEGTSLYSLTSVYGYSVNFQATGASTYSVDYFSSPVETLSSIIGDMPLSVKNGYANILEWNTTDYSIGVSGSDGTTNVAIVDSSNNIMAVITTHNYNFLNTNSFITYCKDDIWKIDKHIGDNIEDLAFSSKVISTDYTYDENNNTFTIDEGVYIEGKNITLTDTSILNVGYIYTFRLSQDSISINMISSASETLEPISGLYYQVGSGDFYTKILHLHKYRGYLGSQSVVQTYSINRSILVAQFRIDTSSNALTQSFNVFNDTTVYVNNLVDNENISYGGIGLKITFNLSMLNDSYIQNHPVYTKGDNVIINITNPNYNGFAGEHIEKTLLDYNLYEFSGPNFNNTGKSVKINSSRLKLKTDSFDCNIATYFLKLLPARANIKFIPIYLGYPNDYNWEDVSYNIFSAEYYDWLLSNDGGYGYGTSSNPELHIQFSRIPQYTYNVSISYVVCAPPQMHFTQRGNFIQETSLPYDPSVNTSNVKHSYLPISTDDVYYPFTNRVYQLMDGTTAVSFDANNLNNVMFNHNVNKIPGDYVSTPDYNVKNMYVRGNNYEINLYLGDKNNSSPIFITTIFNASSDLLLDLSPVESNYFLTLVEAINGSSGAKVRFLQPIPGNIEPTVQLPEIFADYDEIANNITFKVDSFFLLGNNKLNTHILNGISVDLYTRCLVSDSSSNLYVNVYKYEPIANTSPSQNQTVSTIFYNTRKVKRIPLPLLFANNALPTWENTLASINYNSVANIAWEDDTVFNNTNTTIFASLVNFRKNVSIEILPLIFAAETNGLRKATMVNKQPLLQLVNKLGMPIIKIDGNGVIQTPIVSTNAVILQPPTSNTINNTLSNYFLYSVLTNKSDNVI